MGSSLRYSLPACYFPTTVVMVDDNRKFLESVCLELDHRTARYRLFDQPDQALDFLMREYEADPFTRRCLVETSDLDGEHQMIEPDVTKVIEEMYQANRHQQVSVVVVDYAMPAVRGDEFCRKIRALGVGVILLTGEASQARAIELFNERVIDCYIQKSDPTSSELLQASIEKLQRQYFQDRSQMLMESLAKKSKNMEYPSFSLGQAHFTRFVEEFAQKHQFSECYLLDTLGSFVFLDRRGNPTWLMIRSEKDFQDYMDMLIEFEAPESLLAPVKNHEKLLFIPSDDEHCQPIEAWAQYLFEAKALDEEHYYAVASGRQMFKIIDWSRVQP